MAINRSKPNRFLKFFHRWKDEKIIVIIHRIIIAALMRCKMWQGTSRKNALTIIIVLHNKKLRLLPPDTFLSRKMSAPDPTGMLTALPNHRAGF